MPRCFDVAFEQDAVAAEGVLRLALAGLQRGRKLLGLAHDAHALAAAAVRGLDHQRKTDALRFAREQGSILVLAGVARHHGHAVAGHQFLGAGFGSHLAHRCSGWADKGDAGVGHRFGKVGVLGKKTVAGMDRLRAAFLRDFDDGVAAQIRIRRPRAADGVGNIGLAHVLCGRVGLRIHRDRLDAQTPARAHHAAGDFAAIGDQHAGKHHSPSQ